MKNSAVPDDRPFIQQNVVRISHRDSLDDLIQKGRYLPPADQHLCVTPAV